MHDQPRHLFQIDWSMNGWEMHISTCDIGVPQIRHSRGDIGKRIFLKIHFFDYQCFEQLLYFFMIFFEKNTCTKRKLPYLCGPNSRGSITSKNELGSSLKTWGQHKSETVSREVGPFRRVRNNENHSGALKQEIYSTTIIQWRVWSWLRMNASGRPNTCKSDGISPSGEWEWRTGA